VTDEQAAREISSSWARLQEQVDTPLPIFVYPGGSFTAREVALAADARLEAALTTVPGHISPENASNDPYRLPRFNFVSNVTDMRQIVSGLEAAKHGLRGSLLTA
jgi:hypothetical protein